MTCIATIFLGFFSRLAIVYWWFANPQSHNLPFKSWVLPGIPTLPALFWVVLGGIFLPWTTLAYLVFYRGGIVGNEWIVLVVALVFDLVGHGGVYHHGNRYIRS